MAAPASVNVQNQRIPRGGGDRVAEQVWEGEEVSPLTVGHGLATRVSHRELIGLVVWAKQAIVVMMVVCREGKREN